MSSERQVLQGQITMLYGRDGLEIEVRDVLSGIRFCVVKIDTENTCAAMGRIGHTPCQIEVCGLARVGLKHELQTWEFEIPWPRYHANIEAVRRMAKEQCPDGWTPDLGFSSHGSFFQKDGKQYARTYIRRWVKVQP